MITPNWAQNRWYGSVIKKTNCCCCGYC